MIDKRASEVLNLVSYSKKFVNKPISITDILEISQHISNLDLPPSKLDIGKLVYECHLEENTDKKTFIHNQLFRHTKYKDSNTQRCHTLWVWQNWKTIN